MEHTYHISGMTCGGCEAKVKSTLEALPEVTEAIVNKDSGEAKITMSSHIELTKLQQTIANLGGKYELTQPEKPVMTSTSFKEKDERSWWETYKPVLLIFIYIFATTALIEVMSNVIDPIRWMRHFMAGFFLVFSFFKLLNLKGFKESYQMYDVVARKWPVWGYIYAFTELGLGIAFLLALNPIIVNSVTLVVMSVSIIGVLKTVLNKQAIQCACLGDVFNLPMSTVTIIEDGLMIVMSIAMLVYGLS